MALLMFIGKVLFGHLFVASGIGHFKNTDSLTQYAAYKRVPYARFSVLLSGIVLVTLPLLFLAGVFEMYALAGLGAFLTCTAFIFHAFWNEKDPAQRATEELMFTKEIALIGTILVMMAML